MKNYLLVAALAASLTSCTEYARPEPVARSDVERTRPTLRADVEESYVMTYIDAGEKRFKVHIPTTNYLQYKMQDHNEGQGNGRYTNYVTPDDPTIKEVARIFRSAYRGEELAQRIMDYVQSFTYDAEIEKRRDYIRYPVEMLVERNGDCEDGAILAVSLMKAAGLDVALFYFDIPNDTDDHMTAGVAGNFVGASWPYGAKQYFIAEATGEEWPKGERSVKIGDAGSMAGRPAYIYPIR
jgi:transglutaminase-like putative cysteine protease